MSSNISINLPKGWIKTRVEEVCKTKSGGTPSRKNPDYFGGKISWIKSGELNDSIIYSCEETITKLGLEKSNAVLYPKNTVLLAMYGATIGKISLLGISASTNQAICAFYHNEKIITNLYLFWFLKSIRRNLVNIGFGGAQKNISQEKIKRIWIPLPPLNEQKRIVIKIESIFAQIDAAKQQLERLASQVTSSSGRLAQLKSSVLKQVFEGKLVSQNPNDESAEVLLKRLHKNSEKELEFDKEGLPEGWIFLPFGNIKPSTERFDPIKEENRRYVGLEHIEKDTGKIIGSQDSKTTVSLKTVFCKGDLLYGKLRPYLNKVVVADFDGVCSTDILVFQQNPFIANTFLKLGLLKSDFVEFANSTVTGVQHPRTSYKKLSDYPLPLPPLSEQHRIVSKIESIFGNIDSIEKQVNDAIRSLNTLKQSVLKLAFEGKLVPQDPNDEPASVLLGKIKLQKK